MNRPSPYRAPSFSDPGSGAEPTQQGIEPSHDALPPGTRLAEYEILSVQREGRFGIVYLAMDHGLQRHVAIKEYLPAALASRGSGAEVSLRSDGYAETFTLGLESFVGEARLLAGLDHPALARVYRFWEANRTAYMAMPYYEGITLRAARQAMARPPDEAWLHGLLLPLLGALDMLHGASCYPRDISPENILLLTDGRPVLLDFGAACRDIGDRTQALTAIPRPAFAPIEQYAESSILQQGPWTSLYALAAVAYYCIAGDPPMASTARAVDDQLEPLSQMVDRLGRSFPELNYSVALVSAVERALSVRPRERPQSVAEFRRALLGGPGTAESVVAPPAVEETQPHGAPPPLESPRDETGPSPVFPSASDGENVEYTPRGHSEPSPHDAAQTAEPTLQAASAREAHARFVPPPGKAPRGSADDADDAALWAALEAALGPGSDEFGGSPARGERREGREGLRTLFLAVAAVALIVLGTGGWMIWSDYRDADVVLRAKAPSEQPEGWPAPRPAPETLTETPAALPSGAADELPSRIGAVAPAAPDDAPPEDEPLEAEAPAEDTPPAPAAVTEEAPSPSPPAEVAKEESDNPRGLCGPRTQFSLYRCMKAACERPKYYDHRECKYLRVTDEVLR